MKMHVVSGLCALLLSAAAFAQTTVTSSRPVADVVLVPQSRTMLNSRIMPMPIEQPARITSVNATIAIIEQAATTTLEIHLENPSDRRQEAEMIIPVPDGAAIRGFTFDGLGAEPKFEILRKEEARRIYNEIVSQTRDPALLEFIGMNLVRSAVFPVEPHKTQTVRLVYDSLLAADGPRYDYVLPRSEAVDYAVPWTIEGSVKSARAIATVYSPSHHIEADQPEPELVNFHLAEDARTVPGPFRLSYLVSDDSVTASLLAYPDPKVGGGYFLLLAGLPPPKAEPVGATPVIRREVTLVLDRSGSMNGEKIAQVREAARQVIAGLEMGEAFNIIIYNEGVDMFAAQPVVKTAESEQRASEYLATLTARGGTNIHDALLEALRQKPTPDALPIVLFLTDGLPTVGQTSEKAIRELAAKGNPHNRRIFTFGVGVDVNTPLLERIASDSRGTSSFVLPKEDVELKVSGVFNRLSGPVLADPQLRGWRGPALRPDTTSAVRDMIPSKVPDLFNGDQLVLFGQYQGDEPLRFTLIGNYRGTPRTFDFTFDLASASTKNSFVPRLWASRKIATLISSIRDLGADSGPTNPPDPNDPRVKELVEEIVRLSTEFGILTEYTAFLAREGTNLNDALAVNEEAARNFGQRAMKDRSGWGSVNQSRNMNFQSAQGYLNGRNEFYDATMNRVAISGVQQTNGGALYKRNDQWVDSRLITQGEGEVKADRKVKIGSEEHLKLAEQLAAENRQSDIAVKGEVMLRVAGENVLAY